MGRSLQGPSYTFCGTWLCCNSFEGNGAPERCPRGPAKRGSGSSGNARRRPRVRRGTRIPLWDRTFLRKALLRPAWSHSASLRLALHPKNRTLYPIQLPDLGSPLKSSEGILQETVHARAEYGDRQSARPPKSPKCWTPFTLTGDITSDWSCGIYLVLLSPIDHI
jgi:hypothetical protein